MTLDPLLYMPVAQLEGDQDYSEENQAIGGLKEKRAIYRHWRSRLGIYNTSIGNQKLLVPLLMEQIVIYRTENNTWSSWRRSESALCQAYSPFCFS